MEMLRVKGVHFDKGEEKDSLEDLLTLGGLFEFKDVWDRIPQPKRRVERWMLQGGSFIDVFFRMQISPEQATTYIDLPAFIEQLKGRFDQVPQGDESD
jgi:hypothetical protein